MKSVLTVSPPEWMTDEDLNRIMALLGDEKARLVGGCVRNLLLNIPVKDIDISTKITPEKVIEILSAVGIKTVPTGIRFGTVTAVMNGDMYEITTLRRDVEADGRRAVVDYTDDWAEDAARRDFTMNALYADCDGRIYDPLGTGLNDLTAGIIRFIGDPYERIAEDHLRILRYFRFMARYGHGGIDNPSFAACRDMKDKVNDLSAERITEEIYKILSDASAPVAAGYMADAGLFGDYLSQDKADNLRRLISLQVQYRLDDIDARFYLLFENNEDKLFRLSNDIKSFFKKIDYVLSDDANIPLSLYRYGRRAAVQGAMIALARGNDAGDIDRLLQTDIPVFPVNATVIMREFDVSQGPKVGEILRGIEALWIKNGLQGDADYLINRFKNNI